MDFNMIIEAISTQGIWCLLFVYLFYTTRQESAAREKEYQTIMLKYGDQLKEITDTLEKISNKLNDVEDELHEMEKSA